MIEPWMLLLVLGLVWVYVLWGRDRLRARREQRSAKLDPPAPAPAPDSDDDDDDADGPSIELTGWGDVLLEHEPMQRVLIVLPKTDPGIIDVLLGAKAPSAVISAMVVLNRPGPGYLYASAIREKLGIAADSVFAVYPDAIDRTPEPVAQTQRVPCLFEGLERGRLRLDVTDDGAVLATWRRGSKAPVRALIGAGIPLASFKRKPHPRQVFGSVAPELDGLPAIGHAIITAGTLRKVTLLADVPPDSAERLAPVWLAMGIDVALVRRRQPAAAILEAFDGDGDGDGDGDDDRLRSAIEGRTADEVELALQSLATLGRLAEAERLASAALEILGSTGALWFQRGLAAFMAGDIPLALRSYREAVARDPPYPQAWCNLAWVLASEGELDEAQLAADRAIAALPNDPFSVQAGVTIRHQRGDVSGARELLRAHEFVLEPSLYAELLAALDDPSPRSRAVIHRFPKLAETLVEVGTTFREQGELERAIDVLRRAVALDRRSHTAAAELGVALSELGRDAEAVEVYDASIELDLHILRFNRGNALRRLGRLSEAVADYEVCLELAPRWWNARVNLISTLQTLDRLAEAQAHIDELERSDAPADLRDALRRQQSEARVASTPV